jgi:penicillin-binding protein 1A
MTRSPFDDASPSPSFRRSRHGLLLTVAATLLVAATVAGLLAVAAYVELDRSLPSIESLKAYRPPVVSRMYASDGTLIGEFYRERRYVVPLEELPGHLIQAFLAAEDARFYEHRGVDVGSIFRAALNNVKAGEIVQGGSTITQQVVKTLLLSPERTFTRKIKEAILAYRIDRSLSKDQILHLYLNQIYFGSGAYGVEAAARTYFGKSASELTLPEAALLAGLPKAPSRFSPFRNMESALERQRYVLSRMAEIGFISHETAREAENVPLRFASPQRWTLHQMNAFTEEVRRQVEAAYGRKTLYEEGLEIHTTLEPAAQRLAEAAVLRGLRELDKRHGYRGPHGKIERAGWADFLEAQAADGPPEPGSIVEALVTSYDHAAKTIRVRYATSEYSVQLKEASWASGYWAHRNPPFEPGDLINVRFEPADEDHAWKLSLEQDPQAEAAFLAVDPSSGRVLCMVGGKDFAESQFNRAMQAIRQPGSAFKPIIYAAALDRGFTPASVIIDSPIIQEDPSLQGLWKPANYDRTFWGPILLRNALVHSRNVVTIKLLSAVGIPYVIDYAHRLGIHSPLTPTLSLALGASGVSLWELVTAYSPFANTGVRSELYLVERIYERKGNLIEENHPRQEAVISPQTAYLITNMLQAVIQEGTGRAAAALGRPAAGKTGTTNDLKDAWFIGYTPSVLAGAWVGNDDHRIALGNKETGGRAACPIWLYFMQEWLRDKPVQTFPVPQGIVFAKVNPHTGQPARDGSEDTVFMAFSEASLPARPAEDHPREAASSSVSFFKSDLFLNP